MGPEGQSTDPLGRPLEDPSSALAYAQTRDTQQLAGSTSRDREGSLDLVKCTSAQTDFPFHFSSRSQGERDRDGQTGSHDTEDERPDLSRTRTAVHGKDAEGRYIISWADNDPENPKNWKYSTKMINVATISLMAFLTPLCSSIFAPGLPQVQSDFDTDATTASLSISIFVIAFGIGPLIMAPLSETIGRRWVYNICYPLFTVFQIGCALSTSIGMLIAFRFLAGFVGSAGIALGGGTISDMFGPKERAKVVGKYVLGILIGPVVGPVAGGFVVEKLGWRWTFWLMLIVSFINSAVGLAFLRETYAPVLLAQRAKRMAGELEAPTIAADHDPRSLNRRLFQAVKRPLKILFLQPIVLMLASYMALLYGTMYLLFTTFPAVWRDLYGFNSGETGLTYIGLGIGFCLAVIFGIPQIDRVYNILAARNAARLAQEDAEKSAGTASLASEASVTPDPPATTPPQQPKQQQQDKVNGGKPEYRIPVANVGAVMIPIGLFWYAWSLHTHFIVPIIGTAVFGFGMILVFNSIQNYFIDAFTRYAASAIAAGSLFRAIVGAVFPLFAPALYDRLGYSWGTSLLAFIAVALMPLPLLIMKFGQRIRESERFKISLD